MDVIKLQHYIDETIKFFQDNLVQTNSAEFIACTDVDMVFTHDGDLPDILSEIKKRDWLGLGKSYDQFIVFGSNSFFTKGKSVKTRETNNISLNHVKEQENKTSFAKNVSFKDC